MSEGTWSTFELPIRKLLKYLIVLGGLGFIAGVTATLLIENHLDMLQPQAFNILLSAIADTHTRYPALIPLYIGFAAGTYSIFRLEQRHQRLERYKRWKQAQDRLLTEGGE